MIKIISDELGLISTDDQGASIASNVSDYVGVYEKILNAIEDGIGLTVYVKNSAIEHWLKNTSSRYPNDTFEFSRMDAKGYLSNEWETSIPEYVTNEDILASGIIEAEIAPKKGESFENIILETFYDPSFSSTVFPETKIAQIIKAYDETKWKDNKQNVIAYKVFQRRLNLWRGKIKDKSFLAIIDMIEHDILKLRNGLIQYKILRHYKEIGLGLIGDLYGTFSILKPNLSDLILNESEIPDVVQQVEYYLNDFKTPDTIDAFSAFLNNLSGNLLIEFEKAEYFLTQTPELITPKTIGELKGVFHPIQNQVRRRIQNLGSLIKPKTPDNPDSSWTYNEMLDWVTEDYLPYFTWAEKNGQIDDHLMQISDNYAQWLYTNWESIRSNSKRVVFNLLPNISNNFMAGNNRNLIVVIDNFGWRYAKLIKDSLQNVGFGLVKCQPYLSMLPSTTELSKKCLLAGTPTYKEIDNKHYTSIVEKGWVPFFENASFQYISDLNKLTLIPSLEKKTYVLNYLPVDHAMHLKESDLGINHDEHIRTLINNLVKSIIEFIEKHNVQDNISIHIISDHGSTKLPNTLSNGIDIGDVKKYGFEYTSPRYAAIDNEKYNLLPDNLREDCFFLNAEIFGNDRHYLCARRGNRFVSSDDTSYVHGGLSPEETVIPYMQFKKIIAPIENLTILIKQSVFRYRLETVIFEIGNPNEYPVQDIIVDIINSNIECESYRVDGIDAKKKIKATAHMRFSKTQNKDDKNNIRCFVRFTCNGKQYQSDEVKIPITMKAMYELKDTSIFDEFD